MKKAIVSILSAQLLLLLSCGSDLQENPIGTSESIKTSTTAPETEAVPELPERDFGGRTFTFLTGSWGTYTPLEYIDLEVAEQNGEVVNDAAFERNTVMADKYNCKIAMSTAASDSDTFNKLAQAVLAGDTGYDIVMLRGRKLAGAITAGYLADLASFPHIDTGKPWWDKNLSDTLTFNGINPVLAGYVTTNHMNAVWTVCFNKRMIDDLKLDSPYALVDGGKWTFDKAIEMSIQAARDLNGDTEMDAADIWGINYTNDTVIGILNSCGVDIAGFNPDGGVEFTIESGRSVDRINDIFTKLFDESYAMDTLSRAKMKATDMDGQFFAEDKVLFLFTATHLISQLRQMNVDFEMLPYPKYSEAEEYRSSTAGIFLSLTVVPSSNTALDDIGYFLEAYAYEGYKTLKPAFYENVLMGKLTRDEESKATLDYIYENIDYDVGNLLNIGDFTSKLAGMSATRNTDIASFLAANMPSAKSELAKLNEALSQ